jgi:hypothetical protein
VLYVLPPAQRYQSIPFIAKYIRWLKYHKTVSYTLIMTAFGVVSNPDVEEKLYMELHEAFPDPNELCLAKLEKLPYLVSD